MKALVVYESMFGNTEQVARAVARGLSEQMDVEIMDVSEAPTPITQFVDLIVVGGPTHAFSLSKPATRAEAIKQGGSHGHRELGLREWLSALSRGPHSELVASFDTRVQQVRHLPGSAAKRAERMAGRLGYERIGRESFYVVDSAGPLEPGEADRAEAWGRQLSKVMALRASGQRSERPGSSPR